jgi:hypothetical protein
LLARYLESVEPINAIMTWLRVYEFTPLRSVQSSSLLTVRLHRLDFYIMLRKLIPKLQAFSAHSRSADSAILLVHPPG